MGRILALGYDQLPGSLAAFIARTRRVPGSRYHRAQTQRPLHMTQVANRSLAVP